MTWDQIMSANNIVYNETGNANFSVFMKPRYVTRCVIRVFLTKPCRLRKIENSSFEYCAYCVRCDRYCR